MTSCTISHRPWTRAVWLLATLPPATGAPAAQHPGTVAGRVTLGEAGAGVPGVRVWIPELQLERVTDVEGTFRFDSVRPGRHEIRADLVGCRSGSWALRFSEGLTTLHLRVDGPAVGPLRETVTAGTASSTSQGELPFTVEQLDQSELDPRAARTLADLIRGRFPGIKVVQGTGLPGERVALRFRGAGSLSANRAPLIVVDGVLTEGGAEDLDPGDIEKVEILKGSAATAAYGARGGAGVIEVKTRRGAPAAPRCFFSSRSS